MAGSTNGPSRQEYEDKKGEPDSEEHDHRQSRHGNGAAGTPGDYFLHVILTAVGRDVLGTKGCRDMVSCLIIDCRHGHDTFYRDFAEANAASTVGGLNGTDRSRAPVASKTAFATAAATGAVDASPAPSSG